MKHPRMTAATLFVLALAGCIELERVEVSRDDLVRLEGIEGRWVIDMFLNAKPTSNKLAEIRAAEDGFYKVSAINADEDAEELEEYSIGVIATRSEQSFVVVLDRLDGDKPILATLARGEKLGKDGDVGWSLVGVTVNEELPHQEAAKRLKEHYGLTYTKTRTGATHRGRSRCANFEAAGF